MYSRFILLIWNKGNNKITELRHSFHIAACAGNCTVQYINNYSATNCKSPTWETQGNDFFTLTVTAIMNEWRDVTILVWRKLLTHMLLFSSHLAMLAITHSRLLPTALWNRKRGHIYFMKPCAWDIFVSLNWTWSGEIIDFKFSSWI